MKLEKPPFAYFRAPKSFPDADQPPPPPAVLDFPQFGQRIKKPERLSQPQVAAVVGQQRPHSVNTGDLKDPLSHHRSSNLRKRNFHGASVAAKGSSSSSDLANRHQRPLLKKKKKILLDDEDDQLAEPARAFIRYIMYAMACPIFQL